jgi:DNA-binding NarL/FixJ family response regulator
MVADICGRARQPVLRRFQDGPLELPAYRVGERSDVDESVAVCEDLTVLHLHLAYLDPERRRCPVPPLTARQRELLRLVAAGHTNGQIARRLGIAEGTVRTHLENIYRLLQVSSRTAAITRASADRTG